MLIAKVKFSSYPWNGIFKEPGIIRSMFWQIKNNVTEQIRVTAKSTEAVYQALFLEGQRRMEGLTKTEYTDNIDRIAVEKAFALAKHKYGHGLITSRLDQTTRSSIALSVIAMNGDRICRSPFCLFFDIVLSRFKQHEFMLVFIANNNFENLVDG